MEQCRMIVDVYDNTIRYEYNYVKASFKKLPFSDMDTYPWYWDPFPIHIG